MRDDKPLDDIGVTKTGLTLRNEPPLLKSVSAQSKESFNQIFNKTKELALRDLRIELVLSDAGVSSTVLCTIFRVTSRLERWCIARMMKPPHR